LGRVFDDLDEWETIIGDDPPPNSDLADAMKAIELAKALIARLIFNLNIRGMEAAEPGEPRF
jgi:hypothetical protein